MSKTKWEQTTVKDLQVGDIIKLDRWDTKHKTGVVSSVVIVPKAERWTQTYHDVDYYKKKAMRRLTVTLPDGSTKLVGWANERAGWLKENDLQLEPTAWVERQCSKEAADEKARQDEILAHRIGVRTVLSRCETDLISWKRTGKISKTIEPYVDEYTKIFKMLDALDGRMTADAGKDDVRKPAHPSGGRRN